MISFCNSVRAEKSGKSSRGGSGGGEKVVLKPSEMESLRRELDSPGGRDALQELLKYLKTVTIQENPVVKPDTYSKKGENGEEIEEGVWYVCNPREPEYP